MHVPNISQELNLDKLREVQGRTYEDPLREVAALQFLSSHPNVLPCTEVRNRTLPCIVPKGSGTARIEVFL